MYFIQKEVFALYFPVVLDICDKKYIIGKKIEIEKRGDIRFAKIPEKRKALKKVTDAFKNDLIMISNKAVKSNVFSKKIINYSYIGLDVISELVKPICKAVSEKFKKELPFNELIIAADNKFACQLISRLINTGKMFTLISDYEDRKMLDEMYFKYGCIIRYKKTADEYAGENGFVICSDENRLTEFENMLVLNLTDKYKEDKNVINLKDISLNDKRLQCLITSWGGNPGAEIYSLVKCLPDDKVTVEVNKKTDKIFMLDINAF